jgi:hypothetical protein
MKRVLEAINPTLVAAGFELDRKPATSFINTGVLEFSRSNEIVVVSYQRPDGSPRLVAESVSEQAGYALLACTDLTPTQELVGQIAEIQLAIERYFKSNQAAGVPASENR